MHATAWYLIAAFGVIVAQALAAKQLVKRKNDVARQQSVSITNQHYYYGETHVYGESD